MHYRWLINQKKKRKKLIHGGSIEFDVCFWLHYDACGRSHNGAVGCSMFETLAHLLTILKQRIRYLDIC